MKTILLSILFLFFVSFDTEAKTHKKNVLFNVMTQSGAPSKKEMGKKLKKKPGVMKVKTNSKQGTMLVTYNANVTNIKSISDRFRESRFLAFPVGEGCSRRKRGGCLNNIPSEMNMMR